MLSFCVPMEANVGAEAMANINARSDQSCIQKTQRNRVPTRGCRSTTTTLTMSRKQKRTEQEVHAMIVRDSKMRLGCADFTPAFTLHEFRHSAANWDVRIASDAGDWPPDCAQAFKESVARARRKFDIAWPLSD